MASERQTSWGGLVALDMFLGGIGAGAFTVASYWLSLAR